MQWFGARWESLLCEEIAPVPTPIGEMCIACNIPISESDTGIIITDSATSLDVPYHLGCFRTLLGFGA
jgi:hypothetical protein